MTGERHSAPALSSYSPVVRPILQMGRGCQTRAYPSSQEQRRRFPPACPEFVIEVMSLRDRLGAAKEKMLAWIAEGVELAWLIDGDNETVYIYRSGVEKPEKRTGLVSLAGEGPVAGFVLDLKAIWAGL